MSITSTSTPASSLPVTLPTSLSTDAPPADSLPALTPIDAQVDKGTMTALTMMTSSTSTTMSDMKIPRKRRQPVAGEGSSAAAAVTTEVSNYMPSLCATVPLSSAPTTTATTVATNGVVRSSSAYSTTTSMTTLTVTSATLTPTVTRARVNSEISSNTPVQSELVAVAGKSASGKPLLVRRALVHQVGRERGYCDYC
jgi:hypothetical protein